MKTYRRIACTLVVVGLLSTGPAPMAQDDAADPRGFLYGTVETASGNRYTGLIRWGSEEAFWDDLFNSSKDDLPYLHHRVRDRDRRRIKIFGITIGYRWDHTATGRQFVARFGDIEEIRPRGAERAEVRMRSGSVFDLEGGSNDLGGTVAIEDETLGRVEIPWHKIDRIRFAQAPDAVRPAARRLYGKLITRLETFEGFIQWDSQECLSTDELDGETDDGEMSIPMGRIRAIERNGRRSARVELKDGRRFVLRGSNDVDHSIRGIMVEDERFGRVKVSWDAFERLEFIDTAGSGRSYATYAAPGRLVGKVTERGGATHAGALVFDLDEQEGWELLDGQRDGLEYSVPLARIRSIEPRSTNGSLVVLRNGIELQLEDGQDVSERNDGVVALAAGDGSEVYLPWEDVVRIDFD